MKQDNNDWNQFPVTKRENTVFFCACLNKIDNVLWFILVFSDSLKRKTLNTAKIWSWRKQPLSSEQNLTKSEVFMINSKGQGLGLQPEVKVNASFLTIWKLSVNQSHQRKDKWISVIDIVNTFYWVNTSFVECMQSTCI